ncbi:uncharacterized protein LOC135499165 [Lineus longissimus]|uniref:uncharacterized protein LOC135499165 n=1 Tax=Lineus longissimus TaxID=88925 RepID=UPI00315DEE43
MVLNVGKIDNYNNNILIAPSNAKTGINHINKKKIVATPLMEGDSVKKIKVKTNVEKVKDPPVTTTITSAVVLTTSQQHSPPCFIQQHNNKKMSGQKSFNSGMPPHAHVQSLINHIQKVRKSAVKELSHIQVQLDEIQLEDTTTRPAAENKPPVENDPTTPVAENNPPAAINPTTPATKTNLGRTRGDTSRALPNTVQATAPAQATFEDAMQLLSKDDPQAE